LSGEEDDPGDRKSANVPAVRRNATLKGLLNGLKECFEEMLNLFEWHEIKRMVNRAFDFGEVKGALEYLFQREPFREVVITISNKGA